MYYDKRIRYLSYYESDIKLQNAGYVKFQVRDSLCQMIVYVKGPRLMGSGEAAVYLLSQNQEQKNENHFYSGGRENGLRKHLLGNLNIRNGQGHCAVRMNAENMADSGLRYDEICGIRIELHEYQYLESQWSVVNFMPGRPGRQQEKSAGYKLRQPQRDRWSAERKNSEDNRIRMDGKDCGEENGAQEEKPVEIDLIVTPVSENLRVEKLIKEEPAKEPLIVEIQKEDLTAETREWDVLEKYREVMQDIHGENEEVSAEQISGVEKEKSMQETLEEEVRRGMKEAENEEPAEETQIRPSEQALQTDKWEQLRKTYPIVHPISEEEEYLKIAPKDFVIFTEKYQELVHNSFLLHGYYNYKHLILGKKEKEGKVIYYLGVPGTFHDREKTVAVMFGFEAFDGKREPAQKGDFGYYLRRVEI